MNKKPILLFFITIIVSVLFLFFQNGPSGLSSSNAQNNIDPNAKAHIAVTNDSLKMTLKDKMPMSELESRIQLSHSGQPKVCTDFVSQISELKEAALRQDILSGKFIPPKADLCIAKDILDTMKSLGQTTVSCGKINESASSANQDLSLRSNLADQCIQELYFMRALIVGAAAENAKLELKNMTSEELASVFLMKFFKGLQDKSKAIDLEDVSQELLERHPDSVTAHKARMISMFMNMGDLEQSAPQIADLTESGLNLDPNDAELAGAYLIANKTTMSNEDFQSLLNQYAESHPSNFGVINVQASMLFKNGDKEGAIALLEGSKANLASSYYSQIDETIRKIRAGGAESPFSLQVGFRVDEFFR